MTVHTAPAPAATMFDVRNPGTGDVVGQYPVHGEPEVAAAVERAREAAVWWDGIGFDERRKRLDAFRGVIARRINQLAGVIHEEMGKPHGDAYLEVALVLDHLAWAAKNAGKVLGKRKAHAGPLNANLGATVEHKALGVVGVIGPWNYPVFTPMGSIVYALAAGNTIVFKPSEYTPGVGAWLVDAFSQVVPEHPVMQLVTGDGSTGAALCRAGVDKVAFTGSTATAKRVMATCAETLTPIVAECGGKDALLVDQDADLEAAADAAVWGGIANAGQSCIGVERIYVHTAVHDAFEAMLADRVGALRAGADSGALVGPITMPSQVEIIRRHVADAVASGGRIVAGSGSIDGQVVQPVLLADVPEDAAAVREETFGPTLTLRRVEDMDEAVRLTNASRYHLAASVFSKHHGTAIADRIRSGMVAVNSVFSFAVVASIPFGGVGDSGFGRIHGEEGLREFCYAHSVVRQKFASPLPLMSFGRTAKVEERLGTIIALVHGSK
ncbi:aldehyde dehydrogenase (NAD) family protein [Aeromicrobium marinum DSM 15272]|uniref:Aldehyde dehydrogenase n=1 Tax=Aeromicrobium marinum DSM 15272 TaxID=585531 RepID=E2SCG7_9ACTN|nr:aldehyde dehydrogenase family protein [Aeromicrobium marinum]EFQ82920.1 aldehyde dehydrogenase (NAD) family protein [Aeromicrobium marinum DSM 15272]